MVDLLIIIFLPKMLVFPTEGRLYLILLLGECLQNSFVVSRIYETAFERMLTLIRNGSEQYEKSLKKKPVTEL